MRKKTQSEVIKSFVDIHKDKYKYNLVVYNGSKIKVNIICKIHGPFMCSPCNHRRGKGCPKCTGRYKTTLNIIDEFKTIHRDTYDYSLVKYEKRSKKVSIICKEHGLFYQNPGDHLGGKGCCLCRNKKMSLKNAHTNELFIKRAQTKHSGIYDYSLVDYKNAHTKIVIICNVHGKFKQTPDAHIQGQGCPKCGNLSRIKYNKENPSGWSSDNWDKKSKQSKYFNSFKVYVIKCWNDDEEFYKIGRTFNTVKRRFKDKICMPYNYNIINEFVFETAKEAFDYEKKLKREHTTYKYIPLISFYGKNECFTGVNL